MNKVKIYIISSIAIIGIYILGLGLSTNLTGQLTVVEYIIHFWIPTILIINAVVIVPIVMRRRLDDENKKSFIKMLKFVALILFFLGMIYVHMIPPFYWGHFAIWFLNGIGFIVFVVVSLIAILSENTMKKKGTLNLFSDYICPFFTIALIIWSFFIILYAINGL